MLESFAVSPGGKVKMATIFKRKGSDKLWLNYYVNGVRKQKSTGLDDTPHNRKLIEKEVIPKLIAKIKLGELSPNSAKPFSYYFKKFLELHDGDKSYHNYKYIYNKVNAHFGKFKVESITRLAVKEYLNALGVKNKTKKDYLMCKTSKALY